MQKFILLIVTTVSVFVSSLSFVFAEEATGFNNKTIELQIPGNTEVIVRTVTDLTTQNNKVKIGQFIELIVARYVVINNLVVIKSGAKPLT